MLNTCNHAKSGRAAKGRLRRGMLADFAVLSDDLLSVDPNRIKEMSVGATIIGGSVAYNDGAL